MEATIIEYFRGDRCGVDNCNSTRFSVTDGLTYCKNGHQQETGPQTQPDEDDFTSQGRKTRRKKETEEQRPQSYSGYQVVQLYLQSYQLILWKQCYALIHTIGLPAELESVVKDLWALRLQLLKDKADAESESNAIFSSQPETEFEVESEYNSGKRDWKIKLKTMPTLVESLGICYLGLILLRLPISIKDIHGWAVKERIPFIRAIRSIPRVMKGKLPAEYIKSLDTQSIMKPEDLCNSIHRLILFYDQEFRLKLPALNYPLLLFRHVKHLALPLDTCLAASKISSLLNLTFDFPRPGSRQKTSSFPETQLIALLVIAVKIYYPFDLLKRCPRSLTEAGVLNINWDTWCKAQSEHEARFTINGNIGLGNEILVGEADIMRMSSTQLDEYLDWSEKMWVDEESLESKKKGLPKQLLDMFPTGPLDGPKPTGMTFDEELKVDKESVDQTIKSTQANLNMRGMVSMSGKGESKGAVRRLGSFYKRYRKTGDLTASAKRFHEAAASLTGISLSTLLVAVLQTERKLQLWRAKQMEEEDQDSANKSLMDAMDIVDQSDESPSERAEESSDDEHVFDHTSTANGASVDSALEIQDEKFT